MNPGPSVGATTYKKTTLNIDDEKIKAAFDREVFTPSFNDDVDVVSTNAELEAILDVPVGDGTAPSDTDELAKESSDTETGVQDADPTTPSPEPTDASSVSSDADASVSPGADEMFSEAEADEEYSALRRLRSRLGTPLNGDSQKEEAKGRMERYGLSSEPNHSGAEPESGENDASLPVVAESDSRIGSFVNRVRDLFR